MIRAPRRRRPAGSRPARPPALAAGLLLLLVGLLPAPSFALRPEAPALGTLLPAETVPVARPGPRQEAGPVRRLWEAERLFRSGKAAEALSLFLDLAYNLPDDERKGFAWLRVGELLLAKEEARQALEAADQSIRLSKARYLVLSALDLKYRVCLRFRWNAEVRQIGSYLVDEGYLHADAGAILGEIARTYAEEGDLVRALEGYRRAIAQADSPVRSMILSLERDRLIAGAESIPSLRAAAEAEGDPEGRASLWLALGRLAGRKGFPGMSAWALAQAARSGGADGQEAAQQLFRLEEALSGRARIVGLVPLSGRYADLGFSVLSGAEVALRQARREGWEDPPFVLWVDTAGQADRAERGFLESADPYRAIGVIGPLTGEEGEAVASGFGPQSPPTLYLGQKAIPAKPFLYPFGLNPLQEARALVAHLKKRNLASLLLFHPENGYGRGFAEALVRAAGEGGVRIGKTVAYPPDTTDFTETIGKAAGRRAVAPRKGSIREREPEKAPNLPWSGIVVADHWERAFLLSSQLRFYDIRLPLAGFSGWYGKDLVRKGGAAVDGAVLTVDYAEELPGARSDSLRREVRDSLRYAPGRFEAMGYDAAAFLAEAFGPQPPEDGVPAAVRTRERIPRVRDYEGATGSFRFSPEGTLERKVSLLRVELGNFVPVPGFPGP